jgi:hypothetical protein
MEIDAAQLTELAQYVVDYSVPHITEGALAKVGENATDTTTGLVGQIWGLLTRQFQGNRKAEAALTIFEDEPDDPKSQKRLAQHVVDCFTGQAASIAELAELVRQIQAAQGAPQAAQQRTITIRDQARVGTLVQGDVGGDLHIGPTTLGDEINAQGSQGFINRPSGEVQQNFHATPRRKGEEEGEE